MAANQKRAQKGQYLTFTMRGQTYGIPISSVREINRMTDITEVPQTPGFVAGVINLRGKVIPVVNLRMKFSMESVEATRQSCIIVIEAESGQIGMIVDAVSGVIDLHADQIEPSPGFGGSDSSVMGLGKRDNHVVVLIDIVNCMSPESLGITTQFPMTA